MEQAVRLQLFGAYRAVTANGEVALRNTSAVRLLIDLSIKPTHSARSCNHGGYRNSSRRMRQLQGLLDALGLPRDTVTRQGPWGESTFYQLSPGRVSSDAGEFVEAYLTARSARSESGAEVRQTLLECQQKMWNLRSRSDGGTACDRQPFCGNNDGKLEWEGPARDPDDMDRDVAGWVEAAARGASGPSGDVIGRSVPDAAPAEQQGRPGRAPVAVGEGRLDVDGVPALPSEAVALTDREPPPPPKGRGRSI